MYQVWGPGCTKCEVPGCTEVWGSWVYQVSWVYRGVGVLAVPRCGVLGVPSVGSWVYRGMGVLAVLRCGVLGVPECGGPGCTEVWGSWVYQV